MTDSAKRSAHISASNLRFAAYAAGAGILVGWLMRDRFPPAGTAFDLSTLVSAASAVAGVAGTMLGFMIAALAILASIAGMRLLRNMQRTGHYQVLLARLFVASGFFALLLASALCAVFFHPLVPWIWAAMFGLMTSAAIALFDAMRKFAAVLFALRPDAPNLE